MSVTRELLTKIARIAGDERGDPATRAVAWRKLEELHKIHPELFVLETSTPPPLGTPAEDEAPLWNDVGEGNAGNPDRDLFLDRRFWRHSAKGNLWRPYRGLTVTIFGNGALFKWCVSSSSPVFSRRHFGTEDEAMSACWTDCLAPRCGLTP